MSFVITAIKSLLSQMNLKLLNSVFFIFILANQWVYAMELSSSAFTNCSGKGISPPLQWQDAPAQANSPKENITTFPPGTKIGEHRYIFHLYALDTILDLPEAITKVIK